MKRPGCFAVVVFFIAGGLEMCGAWLDCKRLEFVARQLMGP